MRNTDTGALATGRRPLYYLSMSQLPIFPRRQAQHPEELVLVGFRVDAGHDGPQFYTLLAVGGENERPLVAGGRIVFFTQPDLAAKALVLDDELAKLGPAPQEIETFCDVAEALHLVNSQDADPDGIVLECLLVFDDLVRATRLHMPDRYQGLLTELTARLTEGASLGSVFTSHFLREHVEDALLWCIGAITAKAVMVAS
ncbi:MAG TPA: hypothetical protein VKV05_11055 [Terriglobales bacterium]|nr:hypothetical protein [Terriglobales bacterium]